MGWRPTPGRVVRRVAKLRLALGEDDFWAMIGLRQLEVRRCRGLQKTEGSGRPFSRWFAPQHLCIADLHRPFAAPVIGAG
jgi:hypothetical protein